MSCSTRNPHAGTFAASALVAAGLTGTIVDNSGKVGLALFIAGAIGALFLIGRQFARLLPLRIYRPHVASRGPVPKIISARTFAIAAVAMGVMLSATNVFKSTDEHTLSRALNYGAWYGFLVLAISLVAVTIVTISRWLSRPATANR